MYIGVKNQYIQLAKKWLTILNQKHANYIRLLRLMRDVNENHLEQQAGKCIPGLDTDSQMRLTANVLIETYSTRIMM